MSQCLRIEGTHGSCKTEIMIQQFVNDFRTNPRERVIFVSFEEDFMSILVKIHDMFGEEAINEYFDSEAVIYKFDSSIRADNYFINNMEELSKTRAVYWDSNGENVSLLHLFPNCYKKVYTQVIARSKIY